MKDRRVRGREISVKILSVLMDLNYVGLVRKETGRNRWGRRDPERDSEADRESAHKLKI